MESLKLWDPNRKIECYLVSNLNKKMAFSLGTSQHPQSIVEKIFPDMKPFREAAVVVTFQKLDVDLVQYGLSCMT